MRSLLFCLFTLSIFTVSSSTTAEEGMWQPHQIPELGNELKKLGLRLDPTSLSSFDDFPLNAIVSLGGCSASFVSPKGLVVTNHHCVYRSVLYNSTPENNLLANGFLAKTLTDEVPAAPGSRVYVTEAITDVTPQVLTQVNDLMNGLARYDLIEKNRKALIKECESTQIHRCEVSAYHHGLHYFLIKRLEIKDVRLVYVPATSVGKYGGDIDNWQWPRHTGDFGFYRAYVDKEGKPAEFHQDNVPYQSPHFLQVSATGVFDNDFVMAAGYPGSTDRYRTAAEVEHQFTWYYPQARRYREDLITTIEQASADGSQARLNYESTIASLANYAKNFQSMEESYLHSDFLTRKQQYETQLTTWAEKNQAEAVDAANQLNQLIREDEQHAQRDLWRSYFGYATLPGAASQLYRLAIEKQKPDAEREPGYQERDLIRFKQAMQRISKTYDEQVDSAVLAYLLNRFGELPADNRTKSVTTFFGNKALTNEKTLTKTISDMYKKSTLDEESVRLAWMDKTVADFQKSKDPMIRFAVATHEERMTLEKHDKELAGQFQLLRPKYMQALINFNKSQHKPIYADANSSLRITYGQVKGNQPKDGLYNLPFTFGEGILAKDTQKAPFDAPAEQLALIRNKEYGSYAPKALGSVPVNFLSTLDITGGNSGSAILNGKGQLVGLLFDGVYESIIGDWDFDEEKNRAISVDSRYMLWVMDQLDNASYLLDEMDVVRE